MKRIIKKNLVKVLKPIIVTMDGEEVNSMEVVCETKPFCFKKEKGFNAFEFGVPSCLMYHKIRVNYIAEIYFTVKSNTYIDTNYRVIYNDKFYRIAYVVEHREVLDPYDPTKTLDPNKADKIIEAYLIDED